MMPAQRPEDFADGRRDRHRDLLAALAGLTDLRASQSTSRPAQQALLQPQPGGLAKAKNGAIVVARRGFEPVGFVVAQLAHALFGTGSQMLTPGRLVLEADAPQLGRGEQLLQLLVVWLTVSGEISGPVLADAMPTPPRDQRA